MLITQTIEVMSGARRALEVFKRQFPGLYRRLFRKSLSITYGGELLHPLEDAGLVVRDGRQWTSPFLVFASRGLFIVTDSFSLQDRDRVFPLSNDESLFLARKLVVGETDVVIDIGTGSGVLALHAARRSRHVVATDINPKALAYAHFNASLNGLEQKIEFCYSDVFRNLNGAAFDVIMSNPPVIPTPEGSGFFMHSDGGAMGMSVSARILAESASHLRLGGQLQMLGTSFSNEQGILLESEIKKQFPETSAWQFDIMELYNPPLEPVTALTDRFHHLAFYPHWLSELQANRCKRLHYLHICGSSRGERLNLTHPVMKEPMHLTAHSGSWKARLSRLFLAYQGNTTSELASLKQVAAAAGGMPYMR